MADGDRMSAGGSHDAMLSDEADKGLMRVYLSPLSYVSSWRRTSDGQRVHQGACLDHAAPVYTPQTFDARLAVTNLKLHRTDHHGEKHTIEQVASCGSGAS
jgi:hypothetical protein